MFSYLFFLSVCIYVFPISEPYVTEDELKLMLRGAELSGAIEEEEQVVKLINYIFLLFSCFDIKYK